MKHDTAMPTITFGEDTDYRTLAWVLSLLGDVHVNVTVEPVNEPEHTIEDLVFIVADEDTVSFGKTDDNDNVVRGITLPFDDITTITIF